MDIVEIQHNLGHIIADLKLLGNDLASVSTEEMERLSGLAHEI